MTDNFPFISEQSRWEAVVDRDQSADGIFYYGVKTTGVFCRPGCSSRLPKRSHVEYFSSTDKALSAGYRPCRKCHPCAGSRHEETAQKIIRACRRIEQSVRPIKLATLADEAQMSPYHFHRLFKKVVGVTPRQYSSVHQSQRFRNNLETGSSVTDAIYRAGYGSGSGAYDKKRNHLAMEPKVYRKGGSGIHIVYGLASCSLGQVIVAATSRGVCAIELGDDPEALVRQVKNRFPKSRIHEADPGLSAVIEEVVSFIDAPGREITVPLDIQGTAFQQRVWSILREIRPGDTLSYSEVAERLGNPRAVRAVAAACAANKLAVVIPCHRVVSKEGKMSGYRWGVERKKELLEKERKGSE